MKKRDRLYQQKINIYVLQLENGCFYIGQSIDVKKRLEEHKRGKGASFTKLNSVVSLIEVWETDTKKLIEGEVYEDFFVMRYIEKYGAEKVKGGTFLGSSRKRESKFEFYKDLFYKSLRCKNPPQIFLNKISDIRKI